MPRNKLWLEKATENYNKIKEQIPNAPKVNYYDSRDNNFYALPRDYNNAVTIESPESGRKGLFSETINGGKRTYGVGINGLNSALGDNGFSFGLPTPLGNVSGEYNGDVLYGTYSPTPLPIHYYISALKMLLNRGNL